MQKNIDLDFKQISILKDLTKILSFFTKKNIFSILKDFFHFKRGKILPKGVYLYGSVGGGKTTLMKIFFQKVNAKKRFFHYQEFMQIIHQELFLFQYSKEIIKNFIKKTFLIQNIKLICIDEFEIKDISDAMIFREIFDHLIQCNIFIFVTNNIAPLDLYKDGLQRESFIPVINTIKKYFTILKLDNVDYRYNNVDNIVSKGKFFFPINKLNVKKFQKMLSIYKSHSPVQNQKTITINDRKFVFQLVGQNFIFANFYELFIKNLSYLDYIYLSHNYQVFFLENIRIIQNTENDVILRFISFIDHLYLNKNILYAISEVAPELIYSGSFYKKEFLRTKSRLAEICLSLNS